MMYSPRPLFRFGNAGSYRKVLVSTKIVEAFASTLSKWAVYSQSNGGSASMTTEEYLLAEKFNVVAKTNTHARYVNGKLRCTLDSTPDGWVVGASGKTRFHVGWVEVKETIEQLKALP